MHTVTVLWQFESSFLEILIFINIFLHLNSFIQAVNVEIYTELIHLLTHFGSHLFILVFKFILGDSFGLSLLFLSLERFLLSKSLSFYFFSLINFILLLLFQKFCLFSLG
jgi:hypothetical protein